MSLVSSITSRCIYLREGHVQRIGPSDEVTSLYLNDSIKKNSTLVENQDEDFLMKSAYFTMPDLFQLKSLKLKKDSGSQSDTFNIFDNININFEFKFLKNLKNVTVALNLHEDIDNFVISASKKVIENVAEDQTINLHCKILENRLREGSYALGLYISDFDGGALYKSHCVKTFQILADMSLLKNTDPVHGCVIMDFSWEVI
jgi:hypothetical protein